MALRRPHTLLMASVVVAHLAAAPALPVGAQQTPMRSLDSVSFDGTHIHDVVALFAKYGGRSIVLGSGVAGTVFSDVLERVAALLCG